MAVGQAVHPAKNDLGEGGDCRELLDAAEEREGWGIRSYLHRMSVRKVQRHLCSVRTRVIGTGANRIADRESERRESSH